MTLHVRKSNLEYWISILVIISSFGSTYFGENWSITNAPMFGPTRAIESLGVLFAIVLLVVRGRQQLWYRNTLINCILLLISLGTISVALSGSVDTALTFANYISSIFIASQVSESLLNRIDGLCRAICLISTFIAIYLFARYSDGNLQIYFSGPFASPNSVGMMLSLGIFSSLYLIFIAPNVRNMIIAVIAILIITPIILSTNSRTAVVTPILASALWAYRYLVEAMRRPSIGKVSYVIVIAICVFAFVLYARPLIDSGIVAKFSDKAMSSSGITSGRTSFLATAWEHSRYFVPGHVPSYVFVDNTIVNAAVTFGIAFAFAMGLLFCLYFFRAWSSRRCIEPDLRSFIFAYFVYYTVYMMFEDIRKTPYTLVFWAVLFFLYSKRQMGRRQGNRDVVPLGAEDRTGVGRGWVARQL